MAMSERARRRLTSHWLTRLAVAPALLSGQPAIAGEGTSIANVRFSLDEVMKKLMSTTSGPLISSSKRWGRLWQGARLALLDEMTKDMRNGEGQNAGITRVARFRTGGRVW
jgi:hypothetical protein